MTRIVLALFVFSVSGYAATPTVAVSGGLKTGNDTQPLLFTWNTAITVEGAGWAPGESVSIALDGPLNSLGVSPTSTNLGNVTAGPDGTFATSLTIPYDRGITGPQANIPRPGLYRVRATGVASAPVTASRTVNLTPATYTGAGNPGIDWSRERGTRLGVLPGPLSVYSPERTDPAWISVWDNTPVGVYGTVAESGDDGGSQPARISFEDAPSTHYAHDTNLFVLPDPDYRWTVGTANHYFNGEDDAGVANGRIEVEWEALNSGNPDTYGKGNIGLPMWAMPTVNDRVYVVGRWVLDAGHPELGDRTEIHPPRLMSVMRERPAVSASGSPAKQVDIYVSGHGGAANRYPSGMDALLGQGGRGGGRIRDALSASDQQTYFQAGPVPFLQLAILELLIQRLAGVSLTGPVAAVAGPSAFKWGNAAAEEQPINDMDYDFEVPLPPRPPGATSVNVEVVTHAEHTTAVKETISFSSSTGHIHLPYRGADNGIYARTLRFSWNIAPAAPQHFRVRIDHINVKALPGKWQVWSDVSGQWTYLPDIAPSLLKTSEGQTISTAGPQWDVYLDPGDTLRVLVQGYRANCIDTLFGTLFGSNAYEGGIKLLQTCGPVNNDDLGGALLVLPALSSSQGTYTVAASAFDAVVNVEYVGPAQISPECQGRGALSPALAAGKLLGAGLSNPPVTQVSPDGLISVFGQNFAPAGTNRGLTGADIANGALPVNLACTCVQVNHHLAPLLFVSSTQINFQAPELPADGNIAVQVIANCGATSQGAGNAQSVAVAPAAPEFFYFTHNASGPSPIAATNAVTGSLIGTPGLVSGATFAPAKPGDLVSLYATGLGATFAAFRAGEIANTAAQTIAPVSVALNGVRLASTDVLYAGAAPGYAGLYQINIRVPANAPDGDLPMTLTVNGVTSPAGFITVRR